MAGACNNPSCEFETGKEQQECIICSNPLHNLCSFPKGVSEDDYRLCFACFNAADKKNQNLGADGKYRTATSCSNFERVWESGGITSI